MRWEETERVRIEAEQAITRLSNAQEQLAAAEERLTKTQERIAAAEQRLHDPASLRRLRVGRRAEPAAEITRAFTRERELGIARVVELACEHLPMLAVVRDVA